MNQYFGLETFLELEKPNLKSSNDVAVLLAHWSLAAKGLMCVGVGEDFQTVSSKSERLPLSWNEDGSVYALKYQNDKNENFILKVITADTILIMSILAVKTETTSDLTITAADHISLGNEVTFTNLEDLVDKVREELVMEVIGQKKTGKKSEGKSDVKEQGQKVPGQIWTPLEELWEEEC
eukprot:GFUD01106645.1.p1 GENE.GFUD01106645.1~~GFUD01106645.1.p1  ORF type:complete len:180 (+),score=61.18 GFUD01106645.1:56-595(+)